MAGKQVNRSAKPEWSELAQAVRACTGIRRCERVVLKKSGFGDEDVFDIAEVAGFYNMTNRLAAAIDMRPNAEYYGMGR